MKIVEERTEVRVSIEDMEPLLLNMVRDRGYYRDETKYVLNEIVAVVHDGELTGFRVVLYEMETEPGDAKPLSVKQMVQDAIDNSDGTTVAEHNASEKAKKPFNPLRALDEEIEAVSKQYFDGFAAGKPLAPAVPTQEQWERHVKAVFAANPGKPATDAPKLKPPFCAVCCRRLTGMQKYSSRIAWCNYCHDDNGYEGEFDWSIAYATRAEYDAAMAQVEGIINAHKEK